MGSKQIEVTAAGARWLDYGVWMVVLWASLLNLLNFNKYPFFRPEVGIALVGLAVAGLLMGAIQHLARPRLAFLIAALFTAVAIDLNTSIEIRWFYAIWLVLAIVAFFAMDALLKIVLAAFATVMLFQLADLLMPDGGSTETENQAQNLQTAGEARSTRPAIVHLMLDSHLGLDAMGTGPATYRALRAEQVAFFAEHGFQLYPRAYSRHSRTTDSLPRMYSYGKDGPGLRKVTPYHNVPEPLPYFADLDRHGYRINAVAPLYFDLCVRQKLTRCQNWDASYLTSMLGTELGTMDRAKVFGFTLLKLADAPLRVATGIQSAANSLLGTEARRPANRSELYHLTSIRKFDRFIDDLGDLAPGEVRYVHLLLPHSPFGLRPDCSVKPESAWLHPHGPASEASRELAYADQVRCVQGQIARMLEMLDRTQAGREAIVLIHGDHGSRIAPDHPSLDGPKLTPREMLMSHSALFVIRVPGEPSRIDPEVRALDELLADFRARDFASAPRPKTTPGMLLITDSLRPGVERQPLPSFGHDLK